MFSLFGIIAVFMASGLIVAFACNMFADHISRVVESILDGIEYKLALRAQRRAIYSNNAGSLDFERTYARQQARFSM